MTYTAEQGILVMDLVALDLWSWPRAAPIIKGLDTFLKGVRPAMRILLVDDEKKITTVLKAYLQLSRSGGLINPNRV